MNPSPRVIDESRSRSRTWAFAALVASLAIAVGAGQARATPAPAGSTTRPAVALAISVVELRGDGAAMGTQQGEQLGDRIRLMHQKYLLTFMSDTKTRLFAAMAAAAFEAKLLPEHKQELLALAASTHIDLNESMLGQCFLDLLPAVACSTVTLPAEASPDHVARFGRNLDFPSLDVADKQSTLFIYHPQGRYAFASIAWPGMIGVLSGMNEHGLCLSNMEVPRRLRPATAMPYTLLYRTVLERCKTVDEAIDLLKNTPRQTANNLMLMDASGARAVAEITPEGVVVRRAGEAEALLSTNTQRGQDAATAGVCWRYDSLRRDTGREFGRIDVPALEHMLGRVTQGEGGDMTLQSMVFEPANRVIYLSAGADAPNKPFERIDLKAYFAAAN